MFENLTTRNNTAENPACFSQDGLLDLFLGWIALFAGAGLLTGLAYLGGIAPAMFIPIWQSVRQKVTTPRPGNSNRLRPNGNYLIVGLLAGFLFLLIAFLLFQGSNTLLITWIQRYILIMVGIFLAVVIGTMGLVFHIQRMFAYSSLLLVLFGTGYKLNVDLGWILILFGITVMCSGFVILVRFIRGNPA